MSSNLDHPDFRLPTSVRPQACTFHLHLDWTADRFRGEGRVAITLDAPQEELVLHGIDLKVSGATWTDVAGNVLKLASCRTVAASETLALRFDGPLRPGAGTLELSWEGAFSNGLRGLYRSGEVVSTQFEAADARRVFPCFDEPAFKATWELKLSGVPEGMVALANGALVQEEFRDGVRTHTFAKTEVLSSYLIAIVAGPLVGTEAEDVEGAPLRTWALPNKAHLTGFGQEVARNVLPRLRAYFDLPYAFGKVDQVGIPDFEAGAMENAGLVTYREVVLLLDPDNASLRVQKRIAEVVTHELAHQWFGNWVTMQWWDDLWLNEAFATWMAYKIVDDWRPEWRVWLDFDAGKASALHLDAMKSTHPVRGEVRNAAEAGENFDAITYEKGGAVLRMIEGFLGEEPFRDGIRAYMRKHARANATADDLWAALAASSNQPVGELADAWLFQSGFPLITLSMDGASLKLSQRRFFSAPGSADETRWPVPMVLRWADTEGTITETRFVLRDAEQTLPLPRTPQWVCGNAEASGFYRVAYSEDLHTALADAREALRPAERVALLSDTWALVRNGTYEASAFLALAERFGQETDEAVLEELVNRLGFIESRLVDESHRPRLHRFISNLLKHQLQQVGWDAASGESDGTRLHRSHLVRAMAGVARDEEVLREARSRFDRLLSGDASALEANLRDTVAHAVSAAGDASLFQTLETRFPDEADPAVQRRLLLALTAFESESLYRRAQERFFTGGVPMQDAASFVTGLMANREARPSTFAALRERFDVVRERSGAAPMILRRMIEALGLVDTRQELEELQAFFSATSLGDLKQAVAQTLERAEQQVELVERARPAVHTWLDARS